MSKMFAPVSELNGLPCIDGEPVFDSPWQAKTFAMALQLQEYGVFSWKEWADELTCSIAEHEAKTPILNSDDYYTLWQLSLERMLEKKGLVSLR